MHLRLRAPASAIHEPSMSPSPCSSRSSPFLPVGGLSTYSSPLRRCSFGGGVLDIKWGELSALRSILLALRMRVWVTGLGVWEEGSRWGKSSSVKSSVPT